MTYKFDDDDTAWGKENRDDGSLPPCEGPCGN